MSRAVAWRLVIDNPLEAVTPPKVTKGQASAVDEDATAALLKSVAGTRYEYPALVAVTTGVRRGELLALRWTDLDLKTGTMRVRRRADEVPKTHVVFKEGTKTGGTRSVSLMAGTITALKAHRAAQAAERLAAKRWREHGLIFPDIHGEAWRPSTFSVGWGRLKTGLRFHDLRHTHATQLLRAGVPVDAVSKRLGHASPVITMTIYAHVLEDADASAVDRLEATLGRALSAVSGTQSDIS